MRQLALMTVLLPVALLACEVTYGPQGQRGAAHPRGGAARGTQGPAGGDEEDNAIRLAKQLEAIAQTDDPIPDAKLQELKAAGAALSEGKVRRIEFLLAEFRREVAWRQPDADAARAIATDLGGEVTLVGTKPFTEDTKIASFAAKKGVCYTAFLRFEHTTPQKTWRPGESPQSPGGPHFDYPGQGSTPLQKYHVLSTVRPERESIVGMCATDNVQTTLSTWFSVVGGGPGNGLRYVVVATPKESFPIQLAAFMTLDAPDQCDSEAWYRLFADPIPGTLVYSEQGEPLLVLESKLTPSWEANNLTVIGYSPPAPTTPFSYASAAHVTHTPPATIKVSEPFIDRSCANEARPVWGGTASHFGESVRIHACFQAVRDQYDPQIAAMEKARDNAPNLLVADQAETARKRLFGAEVDAFVARCGPLEAAHLRRAEATYKRAVGFLTKTPPKSPINRVEAVAKQTGLMDSQYRAAVSGHR